MISFIIAVVLAASGIFISIQYVSNKNKEATKLEFQIGPITLK